LNIPQSDSGRERLPFQMLSTPTSYLRRNQFTTAPRRCGVLVGDSARAAKLQWSSTVWAFAGLACAEKANISWRCILLESLAEESYLEGRSRPLFSGEIRSNGNLATLLTDQHGCLLLFFDTVW